MRYVRTLLRYGMRLGEMALVRQSEAAAVAWADAYMAWHETEALDHDDCVDPCPACEAEQPLSDAADMARDKYRDARSRVELYRFGAGL